MGTPQLTGLFLARVARDYRSLATYDCYRIISKRGVYEAGADRTQLLGSAPGRTARGRARRLLGGLAYYDATPGKPAGGGRVRDGRALDWPERARLTPHPEVFRPEAGFASQKCEYPPLRPAHNPRAWVFRFYGHPVTCGFAGTILARHAFGAPRARQSGWKLAFLAAAYPLRAKKRVARPCYASGVRHSQGSGAARARVPAMMTSTPSANDSSVYARSVVSSQACPAGSGRSARLSRS